jgi:uncharacterized protein YabE (DUF348 family)
LDLTKVIIFIRIWKSLIVILTGGFNVRPLAKEIIRYVSLHREAVIILSAVMVLAILTGTIAYSLFETTVIINDNGNAVTQKTMKYTIKEVLVQKGINLGPYDEINLDLNSKIQRTMVNDIYIKRAVPIGIYVDGKEDTIYSAKNTVLEALQNSQFKLNFYDKLIGAKLTDRLQEGMKLSLIKVDDKIITEKESVAYTTIKRESSELESGEEKIVKKGAEGQKEKTFRIMYQNGKEIARQLISECLIVPPVDKVVEFGNKYSHRVSRGGVIRFKKTLDVRATAYTASFADTGKHPWHPEFGITRTGIRAKRGIIAVDPRVIPLGTKVYVEIAGDTPDYGYALCADTGGAIKGNIIDLYFEDQETVDNWGVRKAKVYILEK